MEEEIKKIAIELVKLAENNKLDYFTITYMDGVLLGNSDPDKKDYMQIYMDKNEVEELKSLKGGNEDGICKNCD